MQETKAEQHEGRETFAKKVRRAVVAVEVQVPDLHFNCDHWRGHLVKKVPPIVHCENAENSSSTCSVLKGRGIWFPQVNRFPTGRFFLARFASRARKNRPVRFVITNQNGSRSFEEGRTTPQKRPRSARQKKPTSSEGKTPACLAGSRFSSARFPTSRGRVFRTFGVVEIA